jgi:hypothetical protein
VWGCTPNIVLVESLLGFDCKWSKEGHILWENSHG